MIVKLQKKVKENLEKVGMDSILGCPSETTTFQEAKNGLRVSFPWDPDAILLDAWTNFLKWLWKLWRSCSDLAKEGLTMIVVTLTKWNSCPRCSSRVIFMDAGSLVRYGSKRNYKRRATKRILQRLPIGLLKQFAYQYGSKLFFLYLPSPGILKKPERKLPLVFNWNNKLPFEFWFLS